MHLVRSTSVPRARMASCKIATAFAGVSFGVRAKRRCYNQNNGISPTFSFVRSNRSPKIQFPFITHYKLDKRSVFHSITPHGWWWHQRQRDDDDVDDYFFVANIRIQKICASHTAREFFSFSLVLRCVYLTVGGFVLLYLLLWLPNDFNTNQSYRHTPHFEDNLFFRRKTAIQSVCCLFWNAANATLSTLGQRVLEGQKEILNIAKEKKRII